MEVIWTKSAKCDLRSYFENSKLHTDKKVHEYIFSMIGYISILENMPQMGKKVFEINQKEIRQLIYEMHRILYYINKDKIYILAVVHTTRDYNEIIKFIKRNMQEF